MGKFYVKVYLVTDQADRVLAVKLTFADAHAVALKCAPARVTMVLADKTPHENWPLARGMDRASER